MAYTHNYDSLILHTPQSMPFCTSTTTTATPMSFAQVLNVYTFSRILINQMSQCVTASLYGPFRKLRAQQSVLHQGVWFEVCFGGMFRGYVSGYVSPSLVEIMGMIRGMIRRYDSGAWFGVWFAEMQHACDHKFCIRHFWKHSYRCLPFVCRNNLGGLIFPWVQIN